MDRETMDRWLERGVLGLVLGILVFGPLAYGAVRIQEFLVIQGLTLGVIALWILRIWISPRPVFFFPPICWAVIAFVGYAIYRHQTSPIEYAARLELIKVLIYAFLFFAIINNLNRQESIHIIAFTLIGLACVLSIFAVFQFITHSTKVWQMIKPEGYALRGSGTYINPNHLAGFAEMILPLALACTVMSRFSHAAKIVFGYAALVLVAGIAVTLSRGGWVSTAVMLMVFFGALLFQRSYRIMSAAALILLLVLGGFAVSKTQWKQTRFKRLAMSEKMDDQRFRYWDSAIQLWHEDVWLGAGPGHYDFRFRQYRAEDVQSTPQYAHNDYLNTLADWGLIGLGLVGAFIAIFFASVFKTWGFVQRAANDLRSGKSNKTAIVFGGSFGVLAILLHSALDFNMQIPANAILAITLFALVSTYLRFATERFWVSLRIFGKIFATLVGLAGLLYLGDQGLGHAREFVWLKRAAAEKESADRQLEFLNKAFSVEPKNFETAYKIGEIYRAKSLAEIVGAEQTAQTAIDWFRRSIALNPFNPFSYLREGMCLDWLGKSDEATKVFARAEQLDPNGYFTIAHQGWHRFQQGDYAGAKTFFQRSEGLNPNEMSEYYLDLIDAKLAEQKK